VVLGFARQQEELVLTVSDDGAGGADVHRGSGLLGLIDRARAHGGSLTIDSTPGTGTRVTARLPCA
jgi:signal transduction histidine kinase